MTFGSSFWKKGVSVSTYFDVFSNVIYYNECKRMWSRKQTRHVVREPPCLGNRQLPCLLWWVTYAVINLIPTQHKTNFLSFYMWYKIKHVTKFKTLLNSTVYPCSKWINRTRAWINPAQRSHLCQHRLRCWECNCDACTLLSYIFSIGCNMHLEYAECINII